MISPRTIKTIADYHMEQAAAAKARRAAAKQRREEARKKEELEAQARADALRAILEQQAIEAREKRAALIARFEDAASERTLLGLGKPTPEAQAAQEELRRINSIEAGRKITCIERSIMGDIRRG
jgi:hypothetical protein